MSLFKRDPDKPVLSPISEHSWESDGAFNPSVVKDDNIYHMLYRAMGGGKSVIGKATSPDGITFSNRIPFIEPVEHFERFGCEDPRITKIDNQYVIFYTALSEFPPVAHGIRIAVAISDDLKTIKERHLVTPFNAKAMAMFPEKINGKYAAVLTVNTDIPPARIGLALFDNLSDMWSPDYWRDWYINLEDHVIPLQRMNSFQIEVGAAPVKTNDGWLFVFANITNYYTEAYRSFRLEAVLLDSVDPRKVIGRVHEPLLEVEKDYEKHGIVSNIVFPSGLVLENDHLLLYYGAADTHCCRATLGWSELRNRVQTTDAVPLKLKKFAHNPILIPRENYEWEERGVFNPTAILLENKVHILYRAFSRYNTSRFGYAVSSDGLNIEEQFNVPVYVPRASFETKQKPNIWSGCEDPRITQIGDMLYVLYTAYDGVNVPRVALTSISVHDFLQHKWNWKEPILISPPGMDDKDACLLPEKIDNHFVIFHRIDNDIVLDFVDSLDFDGETKWLRTLRYIPLREEAWDGEKVGISATPIKTEHGWLLLYHGVSKVDHEYRVGAMLLDLKDPSVVTVSSHYPILEPVAPFEREGLIPNVVFPCGNVVKDGTLFVYYGGADKVVCVASVEFDTLIQALLDRKTRGFLKAI